jgi:hypothetical protein
VYTSSGVCSFWCLRSYDEIFDTAGLRATTCTSNLHHLAHAGNAYIARYYPLRLRSVIM